MENRESSCLSGERVNTTLWLLPDCSAVMVALYAEYGSRCTENQVFNIETYF